MTGLDYIIVFAICISIAVIAVVFLDLVVKSVYILISDAIISRKRTKKRYVIHYESFGERYDVFYARSEERAVKQFKKKMGFVAYSILDIIEKE